MRGSSWFMVFILQNVLIRILEEEDTLIPIILLLCFSTTQRFIKIAMLTEVDQYVISPNIATRDIYILISSLRLVMFY